MSPVVKKKGTRYHLPSKYILLILTILCVGLMLITLTTDLFRGPLNRIAGYVTTPFQAGVSEVGTYLNNRVDELAQIRDLLAENERLKQTVDEQSLQIIQLQQDRYELNNLRQLYDLDQEYQEYDKIGARIIGADGNWFSAFLIDKGEDDGLALDMNVIADGGLVGRITAIGPTWSRVTSVIADNANVSGMVLSTSDRLIVSGSLELMNRAGEISFSQLIDSADHVIVGDKIVTSNISDKYLSGILIGYITEINTDSNNLSKSGYLTPAVDFAHLDEVLVILQVKQTVQE